MPPQETDFYILRDKQITETKKDLDGETDIEVERTIQEKVPVFVGEAGVVRMPQ